MRDEICCAVRIIWRAKIGTRSIPISFLVPATLIAGDRGPILIEHGGSNTPNSRFVFLCPARSLCLTIINSRLRALLEMIVRLLCRANSLVLRIYQVPEAAGRP